MLNIHYIQAVKYLQNKSIDCGQFFPCNLPRKLNNAWVLDALCEFIYALDSQIGAMFHPGECIANYDPEFVSELEFEFDECIHCMRCCEEASAQIEIVLAPDDDIEKMEQTLTPLIEKFCDVSDCYSYDSTLFFTIYGVTTFIGAIDAICEISALVNMTVEVTND